MVTFKLLHSGALVEGTFLGFTLSFLDEYEGCHCSVGGSATAGVWMAMYLVLTLLFLLLLLIHATIALHHCVLSKNSS